MPELADDLRIDRARTLRGANFWHSAPVVVAELRLGQLAGLEPSSVPGLVGGLAASLPGLALASQASWPELVIAVAAELLRLAGCPQSFHATGRGERPDRSTLVIGIEHDAPAIHAIHDSARVVRDVLRGHDPEIERTVATLAERWRLGQPDAPMRALIDRATARGIPVRRNPDDGTIQLGLGATQHTIGDSSADVDVLFPPGAPVTIPVIAITGTNGKTTTTRLIAHLFRSSGKRTGFTTTDGVYFQEQLLKSGDLTGPFAANMILSHPQVDVAVLETARGGILRAGLGFADCDVAVVTNVTPDHLGLGGIETLEELARVKAVVPSVVKPGGWVVLNGDDALCVAMAAHARARGVHVALFTIMTHDANPAVAAHIANGGMLAEVRDGEIVIAVGAKLTALGPVADVPVTFGGLASFQVQNVLAAVLAAHVQGVATQQLRAGLVSFVPSDANTPGRMNVIDTARGRIVLDYAHNPAAIRAMLEFVAASPASRRIAMLSAPGDRRDEDLREIGAAAHAMDLVFFKEHSRYRRGREPGATAAVMREGLLAGGFAADSAIAFADEKDAVLALLGVMREGDLVAIIADDLAEVKAMIAEWESGRCDFNPEGRRPTSADG
ncbi:MAG: cphA [Gemmatimonadetes bacterium]|nr:cphA [Gemmatimonadota bacterium]